MHRRATICAAMCAVLLAGPCTFADSPLPDPLSQEHEITLDRMIGQMIVVGFDGTEGRHRGVQAVQRQLGDGIIGGVLLMSRNLTDKKQLQLLTGSFRDATAGYLQPMIAVDQEGGAVQRLGRRQGFTWVNSAREIARRKTPGQASAIYLQMAKQLSEAGINANFGPVLDVDVAGLRNPIIGRYQRSYGNDPNRVIEYARGFIDAHRNYHVLTAAKHFPGHGSSLFDSHLGFTDISRQWSETELAPYKDGEIRHRVAMVMVGHLHHGDMSDGDKLPTTLSARAIENVLRKQIGFDGVVVTDDMEMAAVRKLHPLRASIIRAINAGNDILLYSNTATHDPELGRKIHAIIKEAVGEQIDRKRIEEAYERIRTMKDERVQAERIDALNQFAAQNPP